MLLSLLEEVILLILRNFPEELEDLFRDFLLCLRCLIPYLFEDLSLHLCGREVGHLHRLELSSVFPGPLLVRAPSTRASILTLFVIVRVAVLVTVVHALLLLVTSPSRHRSIY